MSKKYWLIPVLIGLCPSVIQADERDEVLVRELTAILKDRLAPNSQRIEATRTLGKLGAKAEGAVPELTAQLLKLRGEDTLPLQETILVTLGQIGSSAKPAIPVMAKQAGRDIFLDHQIRKSIDQILAASEDADLPMLVRLLKNRDEAQRLRAVKALGALGPQAKTTVTELIVSLNDVDPDVRRAAVQSLRLIQGSIRVADLINVLVLDLQDPDVGYRFRAAKSLGALGKDAATALPALQTALSDPDKDVRKAVLDAITAIGN